MKNVVALLALAFAPGTQAADQPKAKDPGWRAGSASAVITPETRLHMAGYGARKEAAEGKEQDLFAKALAFEDGDGNRVVIITLDLIGVSEPLRAAVAKQVEETYRLPPRSLLMNASHTHCGPAYGNEDAKEYFESLVKTLVALTGQSLDRLQPATLSYSSARCGFSMNRRTPTPKGYTNHPYSEGPVDQAVPVLRVSDAKGELRSVLFGYACHNTTMGFLKWLGDYAGYARSILKRIIPGSRRTS